MPSPTSSFCQPTAGNTAAISSSVGGSLRRGPGPKPQRFTSGPTVTSNAPSVARLISADHRARVKTGQGTGMALVVALRLNSERSVFVRQCDVNDSAHSNSPAMVCSSSVGSAISSRIFTDQVVPIVRPRNVNSSGSGWLRGQTRTAMTLISPATTKPSAAQSRRPQ